jgi:hypothetical protein
MYIIRDSRIEPIASIDLVSKWRNSDSRRNKGDEGIENSIGSRMLDEWQEYKWGIVPIALSVRIEPFQESTVKYRWDNWMQVISERWLLFQLDHSFTWKDRRVCVPSIVEHNT